MLRVINFLPILFGFRFVVTGNSSGRRWLHLRDENTGSYSKGLRLPSVIRD